MSENQDTTQNVSKLKNKFKLKPEEKKEKMNKISKISKS